jgi:hypothetical protein
MLTFSPHHCHLLIVDARTCLKSVQRRPVQRLTDFVILSVLKLKGEYKHSCTYRDYESISYIPKSSSDLTIVRDPRASEIVQNGFEQCQSRFEPLLKASGTSSSIKARPSSDSGRSIIIPQLAAHTISEAPSKSQLSRPA